jgi:hypothetical protein
VFCGERQTCTLNKSNQWVRARGAKGSTEVFSGRGVAVCGLCANGAAGRKGRLAQLGEMCEDPGLFAFWAWGGWVELRSWSVSEFCEYREAGLQCS